MQQRHSVFTLGLRGSFLLPAAGFSTMPTPTAG